MFCLCWSKPHRTPSWSSPLFLSKRHSFSCLTAKHLSRFSHWLCTQESDEALFSFTAWKHPPGRNKFFLGAAWVSPRYAHCDLLLLSEQWYSYHWSMRTLWFKGFLKPHSLSQAAEMEKNNSNSFATFARRKRGETWVTLWKRDWDRKNEAAASKNQQSLVRVTFAKCSQLHVGKPTCSLRSRRVRASRGDAAEQPVTSVVFGKSSATAKPAAVFPAHRQSRH